MHKCINIGQDLNRLEDWKMKNEMKMNEKKKNQQKINLAKLSCANIFPLGKRINIMKSKKKVMINFTILYYKICEDALPQNF